MSASHRRDLAVREAGGGALAMGGRVGAATGLAGGLLTLLTTFSFGAAAGVFGAILVTGLAAGPLVRLAHRDGRSPAAVPITFSALGTLAALLILVPAVKLGLAGGAAVHAYSAGDWALVTALSAALAGAGGAALGMAAGLTAPRDPGDPLGPAAAGAGAIAALTAAGLYGLVALLAPASAPTGTAASAAYLLATGISRFGVLTLAALAGLTTFSGRMLLASRRARDAVADRPDTIHPSALLHGSSVALMKLNQGRAPDLE